MRRKICVVTGSRAEYGVMYWLLNDLRADPQVELQLLVTGMHLSPEFGMTVNEIERDGFEISRRVEMLLSSDTSGGITKSMALGLIGMSDALEQLRPDFVLLLGDRFEILAAAQASLIHRIPIVHLAGGDTTEGAFDESIRHAVTKMSHVHLATSEQSASRIRQMGEDPANVHVVGSVGLDHLLRTPLLDRPALESALGSPLGRRNVLVTFHPVTLESHTGRQQQDELLQALDDLDEDIAIWCTRPNADTGGRELIQALDEWAASRAERVRVYSSLGQLRYLSLMALADCVIGNSSSGLYEAPSFKCPTVDIGDRQKGRLAATSVLHCAPERSAISATIAEALALDCSATVNPYGNGDSARRILEILHALPAPERLLKKHFHVAGVHA